MKVGKILLALSLVLFAAAFVIWFVGETPAVPVETQPTTEAVEPTLTTEPTRPIEETNVLRQFILPPNTSGDGEYSTSVFDSPYMRTQIKSITIVDTLADAPEECWDASEARNGAVVCWVEPNGGLFDLYIGAEGGVWAGESARNMFRGYTNAERIDFGNAFHTEGVRDLYGMFLWCESVRELDLSGFDTSSVTDMSSMFAACHAQETVDLSSFETGRVELMSNMFEDCHSLQDLDVSGFNTAKVSNMGVMFENCESLTRLDLGSFHTPKLTMMGNMFSGCRSLKELDISNFDTSQVTTMSYLFMDCVSLTELDLSHFDMGSVSGEYCTYKMFHNCPAGSEWQHLLK